MLVGMLKPACRWLDSPDGSFLYWNYACIARVKPEGARWLTTISWGGRWYSAPAGSRLQGKRWVERWVAAREGPPGRPLRGRGAV